MVEIAAITASVILAGLTVFQLALIFGAPIGQFAWGGTNRVLPAKFRVASVSSIVLYALFSVIILGKTGLLTVPGPTSIVNVGMWVLTGYFFLGIPLNAISRSKPERMVMTPLVTVLALLFLYVALQ